MALFILVAVCICTRQTFADSSGWQKQNGSWVYVDANGDLATGWKRIREVWYYFDNSGIMQTGWLCDKGKWYFLTSSGAMKTGWLKRGGKWYHLNKSGVMETGWITVKDIRYYMNNNGVMQTGWQLDGDYWYYLEKSGAMQTGWLKRASTNYWLDEETGRMATYWNYIDDKWYLFSESGALRYEADDRGIGAGTVCTVISDGSPLRDDYMDYQAATVLANIPYGTVLEISGYVTDSEGDLWYTVTYNGLTGYIYSGRVRVSSEGFAVNESFEEEIAVFPDYYQNALRQIHDAYPAFHFSADFIDMTLEAAVKNQLKVGLKTHNGATCGTSLVRTYMDPYTYLNTSDIFMFAEQHYNSLIQNFSSLSDLLSYGNSFMNNTDYKKGLMDSAEIYGVNPYVLAATITLEKGWTINNADVQGRSVSTGTVSKSSASVRSAAGSGSVLGNLSKDDTVYIVDGHDKTDANGKKWYMIVYNGAEGYILKSAVTNVKYFNTFYNLFSINQSDNNVICGGLSKSMEEGWDTPGKSLQGGAAFCKEDYLDNNQDTYYYIHFNVLNEKSSWWHEYSTGITAGVACARILGKAYRNNYTEELNFRIPVYIHRGWITRDGEKYYYDNDQNIVTGWKMIDDHWYYFDRNGVMQTGWQTIGNDTYFFKSTGVMAAGEWCEGHWLNSNGKWTYKYIGSWKQNSKGKWFGDTSGWYAKDETLIIDDVECTFDAKGYLIE